MSTAIYLLLWNQLIVLLAGAALWFACRTRLLSRRPAVCHALWLLLLLKLVTPPLVPLPVLPALQDDRPIAATRSLEAAAHDTSVVDPPPAISEDRTALANLDQPMGNIAPTPATAADVANHTASPPPAAAGNDTNHPQWHAALLILGASLVPTLLLGIAAVRQLIRMRRLLRGSESGSGRVADLLQEVSRRFDLHPPIALRIVDAPISPMLWAGPGRSVIILSRSLVDRLSDAGLRNIIAHELAHLVRRDHWTNVFAFLVTALFWWNPMAWIARRHVSMTAEACCDALALARLGTPRKSYAQTLLFVLDSFAPGGQRRSAFGTMFGQSHFLQRRFEMIADRCVRARMTRSGWTLLAVALVGFVLVPVRAQENSAPADPAAEGAPAVKADDDAAAPEQTNDAAAVARFAGRVTGPDGKPVRGAQIYLAPNRGFSTAYLSQGGTVLLNPLETIGPIRDTTDADGRFAFDAPDMTYTALDGTSARRQGLLMATADGLAADWMTTWGHNSSSGSHWDPVKGAELDLQLSEIGPPIQGHFLGPAGKPLAGARVELTEIRIPEDRDLDKHLKEITSLEGVFLMADYERTLPQPSLIPGLITETTTDAEGRFTLSGLGRDWLATLRVAEPSVVTTTLTVMTRNAPSVTTYPDINGKPSGMLYGADFTRQLDAGRTITGQVVDRATGEGIAGMWVGPPQNSNAGVSARLYPWTTDAEGRFTITGLPPKLAAGEIIMAVSPPGMPYQTAGEWIVGSRPVLIKSPRGIPFQLRVVDEQGQPVDAEVTYTEVQPNPHVESLVPWGMQVEKRHWPNAPAVKIADGTYAGFVLPGPGAVLVNLPRTAGYRPAHVDPKAFFAPGRKHWPDEMKWVYGTEDWLTTTTSGGQVDLANYEAVVLTNPAPCSEPLELTATVHQDRPRQVHFVDADGQPVDDITWDPWGSRYHAHKLPLRGLNPERVRPLIYYQEDRQLIGFLLARGDDDSPYTVQMQPWGTVSGRVVDEQGKPLAGTTIAVQSEHPVEAERHLGATTDKEGRFQLSKLIPGHRYTAKIHRGSHNIRGNLVPLFAGMAFEDLVLDTGETRNLGTIQAQTPVYEQFPLDYTE